MTTLVDESVRHRWEKEYAKGSEKNYPNIELVRLEKWFFNNKPGKLIEYGFGSGVNTLHLAKCGYEINGVDATNGAITRMVAYSLLNDSFDGHQATFIISNAYNLDITDINITIADRSGNSIVTTQSMNSDVYQSGPYKFELSSIYPNPFNPATEINFSVPSDSYVRLSVYNVLGQEVDVIHEGFQTSGRHSYTWNASDMSSGVYYVRLLSGNKAKTMKAVLMK